jgi:glutamate-1-semialdehyde 2,1-aminomutase
MSTIELECAEEFCSMIAGAETVKLGKNGSDATNTAIRSAPAHTGRDLMASCVDHPFLSVDDWFIGTTPMPAGVPKAIPNLTVQIHYNEITSVELPIPAIA